jgi:hypothetical protein
MTGWKRISERGYQQIFRKRRSKVQATVGTDTATNSNDCREISCRRRNALIQKKTRCQLAHLVFVTLRAGEPDGLRVTPIVSSYL